MRESEVSPRWVLRKLYFIFILGSDKDQRKILAFGQCKCTLKHTSVWLLCRFLMLGAFQVYLHCSRRKKTQKMSAEIIHSKFTQDLVSFSLNGFSKSKVNNNTQQDEKIKHQLAPFDRSEPQLYCHCTLIDISKTLSKCIHTFSETDVFCSSFATLSILGRVSRPIEAVTIELSIALHRLPSPCLHWRTLSYTRVRSVLY